MTDKTPFWRNKEGRRLNGLCVFGSLLHKVVPTFADCFMAGPDGLTNGAGLDALHGVLADNLAESTCKHKPAVTGASRCLRGANRAWKRVGGRVAWERAKGGGGVSN